CPCGNVGAAGAGCANSIGNGAALTASGSASLSSADLVLEAAGLVPGQPGLYFQGTTRVNSGLGIVFGDGLRCAGGAVTRLGIVLADASGGSSTPSDVATLG